MISFAKDEHKNGIIKLWSEAFGDTENVIISFLENICKDNTVVYIKDERVVGMASILPVFCNNRKGRYVYAVATDKEYQGQGICKEIMSFIDDFAQKTGESFLILVPASKSLFDFYKKMGYNQTVYAPPKNGNGQGIEIDYKEYCKLRSTILREFDLIKWSEAALEFILSHGNAVKNQNGIAYFENGQAIEVLNPNVLAEEFSTPFALIKYIEDLRFEKPYFGLAMS